MAQVHNVSGQPRDLADGRVLPADGKASNVDVAEPHNAALIDAGDVLVVERKPAAKKRRTATPQEED